MDNHLQVKDQKSTSGTQSLKNKQLVQNNPIVWAYQYISVYIQTVLHVFSTSYNSPDVEATKIIQCLV